mgnify:CR=1 FL=1
MLESPYLSSREACLYLRFVDAAGEPSLTAFYKFRTRHHIRTIRRGKSLLFRRVDLDRVLDEEAPSFLRMRA